MRSAKSVAAMAAMAAVAADRTMMILKQTQMKRWMLVTRSCEQDLARASSNNGDVCAPRWHLGALKPHPTVTRLSPKCHPQVSPKCHPTVTQLSPNCPLYKWNPALAASIASPNCHPTVTQLSPNCHPTVTQLSPNCPLLKCNRHLSAT